MKKKYCIIAVRQIFYNPVLKNIKNIMDNLKHFTSCDSVVIETCNLLDLSKQTRPIANIQTMNKFTLKICHTTKLNLISD